MRIALIGLPQAGKKTLFHLLSGRTAPEIRKPGEIVEGVADIHDPLVDELAEVCQPLKTTYAANHFVLCPDAEPGSFEWLTRARRCQLVCLVARAFESDALYHPLGSVDPGRDCRDLETELVLADMEIVENRLARLEKESRGSLRPEQQLELTVVRKCCAALESDQRLADLNLPETELQSISSMGLLTLLPLVRVYNVSEDDLGTDYGDGVLTVSCKIEQEIAEIEDDEREEYMTSIGLADSGLDRLSRAAYHALGFMSFYTAGDDECRAWTIARNSPAPVAGGKIHSDIERGFIRAEVIKHADYVSAGSEQVARSRGQIQTRGRDYVLEDGDVVHFLFSV